VAVDWDGDAGEAALRYRLFDHARATTVANAGSIALIFQCRAAREQGQAQCQCCCERAILESAC